MPQETKEATVQLEIRLRLPDSVAREAEASGLLDPDSLGSLLREELHRRRVGGLFAAADRLAALSSPSLTTEEVESEIRAVRAGRAAHAGGR